MYHIHISLSLSLYIYIYIEREREIDIYIYIYIICKVPPRIWRYGGSPRAGSDLSRESDFSPKKEVPSFYSKPSY